MKKMPDSMRARAVKETILMRNLAMRSGRDVLRMFIDEMEKERDPETTSDSNKENEYPNTDSDTSGPVLGSDTDPDSDNSEDSDNPDDIIGYPSRGVLLIHPNQMEHFGLVELDEQSKSSYMSNNYKHLWLVDSGASSHLTNNLEGMFNIRNLEFRITVGDGKSMMSPKVGDLKLKFKEKNRYEEILLTNVKYCPKLYVNLLSMPAALKKGFSVRNIKGKFIYKKETSN